jgi:hypothetical protein
MNTKRTFLSTLYSELLTLPFLVLLFIIVISFKYNLWLMFDGAGFHFRSFFVGQINNPLDFTRYASVFVGEAFTLLYVNFGGINFKISSLLYNFGHTHHIIYPFLVLVYIKWKQPKRDKWIRVSMYIYTLSLISYRSLMLYFHISELHFAHTLTWTSIFLFQSNQLRPMWTISVLSLFTYPIHLFTHSFLLLKLLLQKTNIKYQVFFVLLIVFGLGCLSYYLHFFSESGDGIGAVLKNIPKQKTLYLNIGAMLLLFLLRPAFLPVLVLFAAGFAYYFISGPHFSPWHLYDGRIYATLLVIAFQFFYVLLVPSIGEDKLLVFLKPRYAACMTYFLIVTSYQCYKLQVFEEKMIKTLTAKSRNIPYYDVSSLIGENYELYANGWCSSAYSMSLQILESQPVISVIGNFRRESSFIESWGQEKFLKELKKRNIDYVPDLNIFISN